MPFETLKNPAITAGAANAAYVSVPPAYAGTRTRTWDRSLCLYNAEAATMQKIRRLVRQARSGISGTRLVAIGDSKTRGAGIAAGETVAVDSYPGQLLDMLGASDGMIYANLSDARWSANTGWADEGILYRNYLVTTASGGTITLTTRHASTGFKFLGYISPGGTITITIDGGTPTTWTVPSGATWKTISITGLANTVHSIVIETSVAASLLGVEPLYAAAGLTISNAGVASTTAADWHTTTWPDLYPSVFGVGNANVVKPDVVIMNLGTNTGSSTLDDITTTATNISTTLEIPLLLAVFGGVGANGAYDAKRLRLYDIADALDVPLIDFTALIGDATAANARGLMNLDSVPHENRRGYAKEAWAVARSIAV